MKLEKSSNFYLINKPKTWTSQDLCTKFKQIYKFNKVGHSGTLDPNAVGLMLLATNKYTKLFDYIENKDKTYIVQAIFGYQSKTLDVDSEVSKVEEINLNKIEKELKLVINQMKGNLIQTPPIYSAIKVNGKRLYKYARKGEEVDIPKREIEVKKFDILDINKEIAVFEIKVSEGTYIRTLINDLAHKINTKAVVSELERTSIGIITNQHINYIKDVNLLTNDELPIQISWKDIIDLPIIHIEDENVYKIKNGELLDIHMFENEDLHILENKNRILAIYTPFNNKYFKPDKVIV